MSRTQHDYAVIGNPVGHSLSPRIHGWFAEQQGVALRYGALESTEEGFAGDVRAFFAGGGKGLNVTLPFKAEAARLADRLDPSAEIAGAANVLATDGSGGLAAYNTDGSGLLADLDRLGLQLGGATLLLLGAGGAASGALPALLERDPGLVVVANRTLDRAMTLIERCGQPNPECLIATSQPRLGADRFDLVIDATSISTVAGSSAAGPDSASAAPDAAGATQDSAGSVSGSPSASFDAAGAGLLEQALELSDALYALGYDPAAPPDGDGSAVASVAMARERGIPAWDGLGMLVEQAADSWRIWHGARPDTAAVLQRLRG